MDFKIPAAAKNVKLPEEMELMKEGDCEKGDVVLVRCLNSSENAFLKYVRSPDNKKIPLKNGDILLSVLSDRYATRVLHGVVPKHLKEGDIIDLLQQGGESGIIKSTRADFVKLKLEFMGFVVDRGKKINIRQFALPVKDVKKNPGLIIVIGVNMESGKTTTTSELCGALVKRGHKVGCGKLTGIGSVFDTGCYSAKGAFRSYGILDAGYPSSENLSEEELEDIFLRIFTNLAAENPDFVLLEIADGILQRETAILIGNKTLRKYKPKFILNCYDGLGAYGGKLVLKKRHNIAPVLISGMGAITDVGRKEMKELTDIEAFDSKTQSEKMANFILKSFD